MNIFITSTCPVLSAITQCDKHVVKMCLETTQMLCSNLNINNFQTPYKTTHKNHPCTIWCRQSQENWDWTVEHGLALCAEYTRRYEKVHKCENIIRNIMDHSDCIQFPRQGLTPFISAIPEDSICRNRIAGFSNKSVVDQYRLFYVFDKPFAVWNFGNRPEWFDELKQKYKLC